MGEKMKPVRGTREWAVANIDCCTGCSHDCLYCYARYDAVEKRQQMSVEEWRRCQIREADVELSRPLYAGQVMFPTTHDILPENLQACITVIRKLLDAGNQVLVVSKPHLECVRVLCRELAAYKEKVLFRFTLTARDPKLLSFWEPGAPAYNERRESLCHAFKLGFQTSVSVEPMLDTSDVVSMVRELLPCVSHSIWLGKMNRIEQRVRLESDEIRFHVERIRVGQTDAGIMTIYDELCHEPLVRWKESIKEVVGLELPDEPGKDI
jgi:DNA repair photolyase